VYRNLQATSGEEPDFWIGHDFPLGTEASRLQRVNCEKTEFQHVSHGRWAVKIGKGRIIVKKLKNQLLDR
jgi:hypothetical protein